jgi:cob(I)alamin adenosyltransferase
VRHYGHAVSEDGQVWSVGELAAAAGVTVRALHHYDEVGLLEPSRRSDAGYRLYDEEAVGRLYRILALRGLGFPLTQIASLLDADAGSLRAATAAQLARAEEQISAGESLRTRLQELLRSTEESGAPRAEQLIETMEALSMSVKLTRIYTRQGDGGETGRADARRVAKDDPTIEAGGAVDELCAQIGFALSLPDVPDDYLRRLRRIQNDLFDLGAELSGGSAARPAGAPRIDGTYVEWLEEICDEVNAELPPLDSFILPGGNQLAGQLQVCRTICRRAERRVIAAAEAGPEVVAYLNRLSDVLFILARAAQAEEEDLWRPWSRR